jgi:hypothetical protein
VPRLAASWIRGNAATCLLVARYVDHQAAKRRRNHRLGLGPGRLTFWQDSVPFWSIIINASHLYNAFRYIVDLNSHFVLSPLKIVSPPLVRLEVLRAVSYDRATSARWFGCLPDCHQTTTLNQEKRTAMPEGNNNHATVHKVGGDTDLQEVEEPETLNVVIDGTSPIDYPDEGKKKERRPRVLLAVSALVIVSVALGVSFGLTAKKNSPPAQTSSVDEFMNGLPAYSAEVASYYPLSPQAKALAWMQGDPQYNEYELYRLYQRYALAVLYYSTNGDSWNSRTGWMSNASECSWYQYNDEGTEDDNSCTETSRLSFLDLGENDLFGSIPTELELLSDLKYMSLSGEALSGTIPSEL